MEWRHQLNQRYFTYLLCIFGLTLVELFARLLMLSVWWCFTCFVSLLCFHAGNSFLACKLAINQPVEWRHQLNHRYFDNLLCIFGLPLVELFARLLMLSVRWCFTCFVSLLCFPCRYLDSRTCDFVFCIRGFAFVAFLLGLVAYACFLVELFFFCHPGSSWGYLLPFWDWCLICFAPYSFCYQL